MYLLMSTVMDCINGVHRLALLFRAGAPALVSVEYYFSYGKLSSLSLSVCLTSITKSSVHLSFGRRFSRVVFLLFHGQGLSALTWCFEAKPPNSGDVYYLGRHSLSEEKPKVAPRLTSQVFSHSWRVAVGRGMSPTPFANLPSEEAAEVGWGRGEGGEGGVGMEDGVRYQLPSTSSKSFCFHSAARVWVRGQEWLERFKPCSVGTLSVLFNIWRAVIASVSPGDCKA